MVNSETTQPTDNNPDAERQLYLFQIYYDETSRCSLDPGFIPIENPKSEGESWFEYPAIFRALESREYKDTDLIGVFSPRFLEKTAYSAEDVRNAVLGRKLTIYNFSPAFDESAMYLSPWHQGEGSHPGLIDVTNQVITALGWQGDVRKIITDADTTIFSNFFVAPHFVWREWLTTVKRVISLTEGNGELARLLNEYTIHRGVRQRYQMKIFILERLISLLILGRKWESTHMCDPRKSPFANKSLAPFSALVFACDALKGKYLRTGNEHYIHKWAELRKMTYSKAWEAMNSKKSTAKQENSNV